MYCVSSEGREQWRHKTSDFVYSTCFCFGDILNKPAFQNEREKQQSVSNIQNNQCMLSNITNHSKDANSDRMARMGLKYCVVPSKDGKMTVIDMNTGREVSSVQLPMEVFSSPVVIGNLLIVGCRDNNVYCLNIMQK